MSSKKWTPCASSSQSTPSSSKRIRGAGGASQWIDDLMGALIIFTIKSRQSVVPAETGIRRVGAKLSQACATPRSVWQTRGRGVTYTYTLRKVRARGINIVRCTVYEIGRGTLAVYAHCSDHVGPGPASTMTRKRLHATNIPTGLKSKRRRVEKKRTLMCSGGNYE